MVTSVPSLTHIEGATRKEDQSQLYLVASFTRDEVMISHMFFYSSSVSCVADFAIQLGIADQADHLMFAPLEDGDWFTRLVSKDHSELS